MGEGILCRCSRQTGRLVLPGSSWEGLLGFGRWGCCHQLWCPVLPGRGLLPRDPHPILTASWEDATSGRSPGRTDPEALLCDLGQPPLPLWASFHCREKGDMAQVHSTSSESQLLFLPGSLGISKMSPWQDWHWNLSLKPRGPEPVWGDENTLQEKGVLPGGPGPAQGPQPAAPSSPHSRDRPKG